MPVRTRSLAELNSDSFDHLLRNTDGQISLLTPGSVVRALVETSNRHLEAFYESMASNMAMSYLSQATGAYLDLHGTLFGIRRLLPSQAAVQAADNAIRFYVTTGTLAQRLPLAGNLSRGVIPAGTHIWDSTGQIRYEVELDTEFSASATEVFVPARAVSTGSQHNAGAFSLRHHDLPNQDVKVTNVIAITTGSDRETDDQLRARISSAILASQQANSTAVRFAALSVPGVADVLIDEFAFGAGSFRVVVIPEGNRVPVAALQSIRENIEGVISFGTYFQVVEPRYLRFQIIVSLRYTSDTLEGQRFGVRNTVQDEILRYMGEIPPGGEMVVTELGSRIKNASPNVYDYRIEALCLNGRYQLLHNVRLRDDELFLPDSNLSDPVRVI